MPMKKSSLGEFRTKRRPCLNQAWLQGDDRRGRKSSGEPHRAVADYSTPCRSQQIVPPTDNEVRPVNLPARADSENTRQPRRFGYSGRLGSFSRPAFPESIPVALAIRRRSFRTVFGAGNLWVCAKASTNCFGKPPGQTRGFTSCHAFG